MKLASLLIVAALAVPHAAAAEPPSPGGALVWSIGGTIVGAGLFAAGVRTDTTAGFIGGEVALAIGPSAGHFYAGETGHGAIVSGLRAGSILLVDVGVAGGLGCAFDEHSDGGCTNGPGVLIVAGLAGFAGLTIYDWIDAPRAARRTATRERAFAVAPLVVPGERATGLALVGRF